MLSREFLLSNFQIVAFVLMKKFQMDWKKNYLGNIAWSVIGKQTAQAKEVYSRCSTSLKEVLNNIEHDRALVEANALRICP